MVASNILLVEDNPIDAQLVASYLDECDDGNQFLVDVVPTATDGINKTHSWHYQAILVDLNLPDSSGLASMRRLLTAAPNVPIIVLTGRKDDVLAEMAIREGAQDYLVKDSINQKALQRVLNYSISRHEQVSKLRVMAYHDCLTGLPNRTHVLHNLRHDIEVCQRNNNKLALHYIDLDNFKMVNDTWGHEAGDALLLQFSDRLSKMVRSSDTAGRLGGDEFVVIQNSIQNEENARIMAHKIIELFEEPFVYQGQKFASSCSIGTALCPTHSKDPSCILRKADAALYASKAKGDANYSIYNCAA